MSWTWCLPGRTLQVIMHDTNSNDDDDLDENDDDDDDDIDDDYFV